MNQIKPKTENFNNGIEASRQADRSSSNGDLARPLQLPALTERTAQAGDTARGVRAMKSALASSKRRLKCPVCKRTVERQSRQQAYCSTKCRMRAFREKKPAWGGSTGGVTNPPKEASKTNILQWPKAGSSLFCNGPLNLLGGGGWKWPQAGHLDRKTLTKVRWCEVGGEVALPPEEDTP
jgi:hypothetical protein